MRIIGIRRQDLSIPGWNSHRKWIDKPQAILVNVAEFAISESTPVGDQSDPR
jgi:hypothetical protein